MKKKKDETWFEEEYFCYECGTKMEKVDAEVLVCPNCKHSVEIDDYYTEEETYENFYGSSVIDEIPDICDACGGPWPECQPGCRLFRD
jgi:hypothetical protein